LRESPSTSQASKAAGEKELRRVGVSVHARDLRYLARIRAIYAAPPVLVVVITKHNVVQQSRTDGVVIVQALNMSAFVGNPVVADLGR
jgi:hypothetical protein